MSITVPCVVPDMDEQTYHADPVPGGSLSSTGAKRILRSPARYHYDLTHRVEKKAFDIGHAVHAKVLGVGMEIVEVQADSWRTNAAKVERDEAYAAGRVPMLTADLVPVNAMTEAVLAHPLARAILERDGLAEASAFARDLDTGVWLRARPDYLWDPSGGRTMLADLKTSTSADPRTFGRTAATFGYHQQDDLYQRVVRQARGDDDTAFVFIVVEVDPPHLVSVVELDAAAKRIGAERNRRAIDLYAQCKATDTWPGYPDEVALVSLPKWAEYEHEDLMEMTA